LTVQVEAVVADEGAVLRATASAAAAAVAAMDRADPLQHVLCSCLTDDAWPARRR
jgi:hypothetical protein